MFANELRSIFLSRYGHANGCREVKIETKSGPTTFVPPSLNGPGIPSANSNRLVLLTAAGRTVSQASLFAQIHETKLVGIEK